MEQATLLKELADILRQVLDDDTLIITPETTAADIPQWDSLNHINIIVSIEARYDIKMQTAEIEDLRNVGDALALIQKKRAAKQG